METKEYKLLDGRTIRAKYNRLGRCNISKENLEEFVKEFNASYRQAKILEKIKENYALMKADERKKGKWTNGNPICPCCGEDKFKDLDADIWADWQPKYCPNCGAEMEGEDDSN